MRLVYVPVVCSIKCENVVMLLFFSFFFLEDTDTYPL